MIANYSNNMTVIELRFLRKLQEEIIEERRKTKSQSYSPLAKDF